MKKGFTLVEVLGIMVILGIIMVMLVPNVMKTLKNGDEIKYNNFLDNIFLAAENYVQKNIEDFPELNTEGGTISISVGTLISERLVKEETINPRTNSQINNTDVIVVTKDSDGTLDYTYSDESE